MKRWPVITASIVGYLSVFYVGMAVGLGTSLTTTATVILVIVCPVFGGARGLYPFWMRCSTVEWHSASQNAGCPEISGRPELKLAHFHPVWLIRMLF